MSNCGFVEFSITDGTVVIDLLGSNRHGSGFGVQRYTPGRPQLKNGGVWADSPLAVGRQLVAGIDSNIADALTLVCGGSDQDQIIRHFEELDLLLAKAQAYWTTTWQQTPVYLRARAKGETARRYALIHYAKYDEYFNPYGELFAGDGFKVATEEFILGIERGPWLDLPPGQSESVPITHEGNSGNPVDASGDFDTSEGLVIGNNHNPGLTHVYQFTASGSVFSANLLEGSPPYTLLGATMAVGNILYIGADFPFFGVKFELSTPAGDSTIAKEFWDGAAWSNVTAFDFEVTTPQTWRFSGGGMGNWAKTTVNARNKYWVRARVTAVVNSTSPVQANRHIYALTTTYVEVAEDEIAGTQDALLKMSGTLIGWGIPATVHIGLRSYSRGADFQSNINVGGGNPDGVTTTVTVSGGLTENTADGLAPGGASSSATGMVGWATMVSFHFAAPALSSFFGRFRLFARVTTGNGTALSAMRYSARAFNAQFGGSASAVQGEIKLLPAGSTTDFWLQDLGYITLPLSDFMLYADDYAGFDIDIRAFVPGAETLKLWNIVLLPADEWTAEITADVNLPNVAHTQAYILDAISYPKYPKRSFATEADGDITSPILAISNGVPILHANARQSYWFAIGLATGSGARAFAVGVRMAKSQRYIGLRSGS